jgi:hypothetical protein
MAATPEQTSLAADPSTDAQTLADLAHAEPDLWPAIAAHPNAYPGLIDWMHENARPEAPVDADSATDSVSAVPNPWQPAASVGSEAPIARKPLSWRRLKIPLIAGAAVVVIAGLVLGGVYAYAAFVQPHGAEAAGGTSSSATDYRFGAKQTWQTKVKVVPPSTDGSAGYYASVESYPGLWLVSWPGDDSGSGRLTDETLLGMDPVTGAVKWSVSGGPYDCAPSLSSGALLCVDTEKASLMVLDPSTGKATGSALNGAQANSVNSYKGDIVLGYENGGPGAVVVVDTVERAKLDGTVEWKKSGSCSGVSLDEAADPDGVTVSTPDELNAAARSFAKMGSDDAYVEGPCLGGTIDLDSGAINANASVGDDSCEQYSPFENDGDGLYAYGDSCVTTKYPILIPRGDSTLTAITMHDYQSYSGDDADFPTVWSVDLPGARFSADAYDPNVVAHLGGYALLESAGNLYGVNTQDGTSWLQSNSLAGDRQVVLLPIDPKKPNTPVLALETDHDTVVRLDPGFGAARVSAEPAILPSCPKGQTPVSFSTWDKGKGATLVCQGFAHTVTVVLIVGGKTYTSAHGSITPTGYYADFGGGVSVDIGLGGWAAWVAEGNTTTLHGASSGWQIGDVHAQTYPALKDDVEACPVGTYPLSLSTWKGGWLLTCGEKATAITRFVYVDGSAHGSGHAMTAQGGQSCGTNSAGHQVCVSASPAVVTFSSSGGSRTQHSVDANYVVGKGFSGAGKGTGAYGLADPRANAASEVAYLNGILQQSQTARSSVKTVVQNILKCASVQADVQNAQTVVDDRTTELQALNSAPVDAVPGGSALVGQLRAVLQDSLTADQAYVTAAGQVASGQCPAGTSTYNGQMSLIAQITSEKTAFANTWNSQIAPQYGTPTYTQNDI